MPRRTLSPNLEHGNLDVVTDNNLLSDLPGQNQHPASPRFALSPRVFTRAGDVRGNQFSAGKARLCRLLPVKRGGSSPLPGFELLLNPLKLRPKLADLGRLLAGKLIQPLHAASVTPSASTVLNPPGSLPRPNAAAKSCAIGPMCKAGAPEPFSFHVCTGTACRRSSTSRAIPAARSVFDRGR